MATKGRNLERNPNRPAGQSTEKGGNGKITFSKESEKNRKRRRGKQKKMKTLYLRLPYRKTFVGSEGKFKSPAGRKKTTAELYESEKKSQK